jgi:hypothetical protein
MSPLGMGFLNIKNWSTLNVIFCDWKVVSTIVWGHDRQKNNSKNKNQIFEIFFLFKICFLHGEKENFEEYSLNLASDELSFPSLINYSTGKCQTYPQTTICKIWWACRLTS